MDSGKNDQDLKSRMILIEISGRQGHLCVDSGNFTFKKGDYCICSENGNEYIAEVKKASASSEYLCNHQPLRHVIRKATSKDIEKVREDGRTEEQAFKFCIEKINTRELKMKLVKVKVDPVKHKIVFYYTAEARVDFRELVKDLAGRFRARIEMRQIGVRDEAKLLQGCGICGRGFCCSTFLLSFAPISIRMAKQQNINLNPAKISGICGRLMCCLSYEIDNGDGKSSSREKQNASRNSGRKNSGRK